MWLGDEPLPGAADAVERLRRAGLPVAFLTNNSSLTVDEYLAKLERCGVVAHRDAVLTSAEAAAELLRTTLPVGAGVMACAGPGVVAALQAAGFRVTGRSLLGGPPCAAVVVGWHRTFDFDELARASDAIRRGARFIATNTDPTYPAPGGLLPGNGALVAAVATASGVPPEVAGKPEAPTVALVRARVGGVGIVIGDRPTTDGALARALGWPFALVHSDATADDGDAGPAPDLAAPSLAELVGPLLERYATSDAPSSERRS
jgi:4-nitrophenyl phosphatase